MKSKDVNKTVKFLEVIKWIIVALLLVLSVISNEVFHSYDVYVKLILICIIILVMVFIIFTTKIGRLVFIFGKESCVELQKVVWPTYQESVNTTLIVVVVTILMSLLVWGLDAILVHIIALGLRL